MPSDPAVRAGFWVPQGEGQRRRRRAGAGRADTVVVKLERVVGRVG